MNLKKFIKDMFRPMYRGMLALKHRGDRYCCPLCGKKYNQMRPVYGRHSDGAIFKIENSPEGTCWWCNSYPRYRQLWFWLNNDFRIKESPRLSLLHVAPEQQLMNKFRKMGNLEYVAIDKKCSGYEYSSFVKDGDILQLDYADNSFDMVICNHVLEHIIDDRKAMSEIHRVLKPGAPAILMVPMDYGLAQTDEEKPDECLSPQEREARFGQSDHVRQYGLDYFHRLEECGFVVKRVSYPDKIVEKYALLPGEEIIIAYKE